MSVVGSPWCLVTPRTSAHTSRIAQGARRDLVDLESTCFVGVVARVSRACAIVFVNHTPLFIRDAVMDTFTHSPPGSSILDPGSAIVDDDTR